MRWGCQRFRRRSSPATWVSRCSGSRASATWRPGCSRSRSITPRSWRPLGGSAKNSSVYWRQSLLDSDQARLSVSLVDVKEGRNAEFLSLARSLASLILRKGYGRAEVIRDEVVPQRYYIVRHWTSADAAERCHTDKAVQAIAGKLYELSRVTHVVNGVRRSEGRPPMDDRRSRVEAD